MKDICFKIILLALLCLFGSPVYSLNLSNSPLFLGGSASPNVFFLLDDSGSMDWEIMAQPHWMRCAYDPEAAGGFSSNNCGWLVEDGVVYVNAGIYTSDRITYMSANGDNAYGPRCTTSYTWHMDCATRDDWRAYSSDLNTVYYNPDSTYTPWNGACLNDGTACTNASFSLAKSNPREGSIGYSQTRDLTGTHYEVWIDDAGFSGSRPNRGTNTDYTSTANGVIDFWDSHIRVTLNTSNALIEQITYAPDSSDINVSRTTIATLTTPGICYNALGTQSLLEQINAGTLTANSFGAAGCRTLAQAQQNLANWFEYGRRRAFAAKGAVAAVVQNSPNMRYGLTLINDDELLFTEVPTSGGSTIAHNQTLLSDLFAHQWRPRGTPLRQGLEMVGDYFDGGIPGFDEPIVSACQQNFAIVLTDGFWNGNHPAQRIGDNDKDGRSRTFADVANFYYTMDLSPFDDLVPGNPRDHQKQQHLVTFSVAFGITGNLSDTDSDGWPNPALVEDDDWGNPHLDDLAKVDDLWHASYNSRGTFVSAQTPEAISEELAQALEDIHTRISSSASVAQNTSLLTDEARVYQTQFNADDWKGHLLAFPISESGVSDTAAWDAGCRLTGGDCLTALSPSSGISANDRVILTYNPSEKVGVPFRFPANYQSPSSSELSSGQVTYLLTGVSADHQTTGESRVNYLRGNQSDEEQNGGTLRGRSSILGDFIHSSPAYVGPPSRRYNDNMESASYLSFKAAHAYRDTVIYVGANDGMLHGFDVSNGDEVLAYVPASRHLFERLYQLTDPTYLHQYYVDGSPKVVDAFVDGSWKTILAGSLNAGGQGIYALDVTDPSQFSESNADSLVLWEFTDEDDARLGYTFSEPQIARLRNGEWAVIIGNGYNSDQADGFAASNNQASLFILLIDGGLDGTWTENVDYFVIPVGPTNRDNGLSTPALVDINGDFITDYIYAGDLDGNLWQFDLTSTSPGSWSGQALFDAGSNKPITAAPVAGRHPSNTGVIVYVGTGQYIEADDNSNNNQWTQTFYGIHDQFDGNSVSESDLLEQNITGTRTVNGGDFRISTNHDIDWAVHDGWKMDLMDTSIGDNRGERVSSQAILRSGRIIFTTIIPSSNTCEAGGSSWIMELDALDGSQLGHSPFDLNNDDVFNSDDLLNIGDINGDGNDDFVSASGIESAVGVTAKPTILLTQDRKREIKVISGSSGLGSFSENPGYRQLGRQNWKRLK